MYFRYIIIILIFSVSYLNGALTLSDLVSMALENNPETKKAWWEARRAQSAVGVAESKYFPKVDFRTSVKGGRDFKFLNGPDTTYANVEGELVLSMMLYDFGESKASVEAAKYALLAGDWQSNFVMQKVIVEVLETAYNTLDRQEAFAAASLTLQDGEKMLQMACDLHRVGLTPISDVHMSRALFAQLQMETREKKSSLAIQKGKLAVQLGLDPEGDLDLSPLGPLCSPLKQKVCELTALAKEKRMDLMARQAKLAESRALFNKVQKESLPKLYLNGFGGGEQAFHDRRAHGAHYGIRINLDIPLFTGFEATYQKRRALAEAEIAAEELAQLEKDITLEIVTFGQQVEAGESLLSYAEESLKYALLAYEGTLEKYHAGKEGIAEVSQSLKQLASSRQRLSETKTKWLVAIANLAYATGGLCISL